MHLDQTAEQRELRTELRAYFSEMMTPEVEAELASQEGGPLYKRLVRQIAADGWLGVGWPKEYGGQDRSPVEQLIFFDEAQRASAPVPMLSVNTVGPTIMRFGSDEQKDHFLPAILKGEVHFAIGYSEPAAGTDLASLRTRAVRDGDEWVIDGQKMWTSLANEADYIWLAARTDPSAAKHKGISIFLVPTSSPGFSLSPIWVNGGGRTNATFYEGVRVRGSALVGEVNAGWRLITNQLNHERVAICNAGVLARHLDDVRRWAQSTERADGRRVIDQEWAQLNLARVAAKTEVLSLFNAKVAWALTEGALNPADASATKVFGSEAYIECYDLLLEVVGQVGYLKRGSPGAVLAGRLEQASARTLVLTFGGGANEIQRDIIATAGLGLPRAPR